MKPLHRPYTQLTATLALTVMFAASAGCSDDATTGPGDTTTDMAGDATADASGDGQSDAGDTTTDADAAPDLAPGECPPPPDDLPTVTVAETETIPGRLYSVGELGDGDLSPREVRVYLPAGYDDDAERRYPVLYMHDGQNLFDPREAAFGQAWEVDRSLDRLIEAGHVEPWIVVGVNNTSDRTQEYTPEGLGDDYVDFLVEIVKPVVDANFRTLCGRENTGVAGSSLGGLISLTIATQYPDVFGRIGAVSPSIWWDDRVILDLVDAFDGPWPLRLWIDGGTAEGPDPGTPGLNGVVRDTRDLRSLLDAAELTLGDQLGYYEILDGRHNETAWGSRLDTILGYLLTDEDWTSEDPDFVAAWPVGDALRLDGDDPVSETAQIVNASWGDHRLLTLANDDVTFEVLSSGLASVDADGLITALDSGMVRIEATWRGQSSIGTIPVVGGSDAYLAFLILVPGSTPEDDTIYITGNVEQLGEWAPDGLGLRRLNQREWRGSIIGPIDTAVEWKVTRGSAETVEVDSRGEAIANRETVIDDRRVLVFVSGWADSE